jgi:UDP-N-acetylglucosamine 4,6-dehydratase
VKGQTILVTGGSGTFGLAFVRYALAAGVARVIVLSRGEHRQAELRQAVNDPRLETWIGDVRDRERLRLAFQVAPDVVIHAAALKRVEVCEQDPDEAIETNIEGTRNVVKAAMWAGIPQVLVISSDKACSPETIYGTTKAAAEAAALSQNRYRGNGPTRISAVRYGNVLGSQGSFLDQMFQSRQTGESLPITEPSATRFWWAIEDAVAFVGTVLSRMQGAEIWVPKLVSARVVDLARAIAPAAPHHLISTRGPEKVHEFMINATEARYAWELPDAYVLLPKTGQWWSPEPPAGAIKVADGFSYSSNDDPLSVHLEALEAPSCSSAL